MPNSAIDPKKRPLAQRLRANVMDAELKTWYIVRNRRILGAKFRRQQVTGPHVVDFFCAEFGLIVEIDGSQHAEEQAGYDRSRTRWLEQKGYKVTRFWNNDVLLEPRSVADAIYHALVERGAREPPQSGPSVLTAPPQGGSGRGAR
jgi:very-short-patch-repair endonuclease